MQRELCGRLLKGCQPSADQSELNEFMMHSCHSTIESLRDWNSAHMTRRKHNKSKHCTSIFEFLYSISTFKHTHGIFLCVLEPKKYVFLLLSSTIISIYCTYIYSIYIYIYIYIYRERERDRERLFCYVCFGSRMTVG